MSLTISSSRVCSLLCCLFLAAIAAVKVSPAIGALTFFLIGITYVSWGHIVRAMDYAANSVSEIDAGVRKWSGRENWPEALVASSIFYVAGILVWVAHLLIENWRGREIAVAVLVSLLSITVSACKMRRESVKTANDSEDRNSFDHLCAGRRRSFFSSCQGGLR